MTRRYSIAEARHNLAAIVHELEHAHQVALTRRGEPVAVLISISEYQRLTQPRDFWEAYSAFRAQHALDDASVDELLQQARDSSPGRTVAL